MESTLAEEPAAVGRLIQLDRVTCNKASSWGQSKHRVTHSDLGAGTWPLEHNIQVHTARKHRVKEMPRQVLCPQVM